MKFTCDQLRQENLLSQTAGAFRADVLRGLSAPNKHLPCKYFYDATGSALFERITELPEYYPTRTELEIMHAHRAEMARCLGPRCLLIEYGSGSSMKTRLLLDCLSQPVGYVPIDVSREFLHHASRSLMKEYPNIQIMPLCADFTQPLPTIPTPTQLEARRIVYFPGSTIGNLPSSSAIELLNHTAKLCGPGGGMLLGADLQKDIQVLEAAYNDREGVTAAFNRNLLRRINRELQADFQIRQFSHQAFYNRQRERIEMHLVSHRRQQIHIGTAHFSFDWGESIRTECSRKYTLEGLRSLVEAAGFETDQLWLDPQQYFAVLYLTVSSTRL